MSWGFSYAGTPKAVAEKVKTDGGSYCPSAIKDMIGAIAAAIPEDRILFVDSNGHTEARRAPEKMYDNAKSKEAGRSIAADGSDFNPDPLLGDLVSGSAVITFKILPKTT